MCHDPLVTREGRGRAAGVTLQKRAGEGCKYYSGRTLMRYSAARTAPI